MKHDTKIAWQNAWIHTYNFWVDCQRWGGYAVFAVAILMVGGILGTVVALLLLDIVNAITVWWAS
jgi:hypothetical protein